MKDNFCLNVSLIDIYNTYLDNITTATCLSNEFYNDAIIYINNHQFIDIDWRQYRQVLDYKI